MKVHRIRVGLFLGGNDHDQFYLDILVPNNFDKWSDERKEEYLEKNKEKYLREAIDNTCPYIKDWEI